MMKKSKLAKAIAMALAGSVFPLGAVSTAVADSTTMYNLTTREGEDFSTNTVVCAPCNGSQGTDGWVWGFQGAPLGSTNSAAKWAGTGGINTTPFGYNGGGVLHWAAHMTAVGDTAEISGQDSLNRYGVAADLDTAKGAWSDVSQAGAGGWRHDLEYGLFKSEVSGTVKLTIQGINQAGTNFGYTIFKGSDTGTGYNHHGPWNAGNNTTGITADSVPGGGTTFSTNDIVAYSTGGDSPTHLNTIGFKAEAGQVYTIVLGGYKNGAWGETVDGYKLTVALTPPPHGDFDGDGKADLFWRKQARGANRLWLMDGSTRRSGKNLAKKLKTFVIGAVDDFSGDDKADVLWRNPNSGQNQLWLMNGDSVASAVLLPDQSPVYSELRTGDFDGDRKTDILWHNPSTDETSVWLLNGTSFGSALNLPSSPAGQSLAGVGDCNGDGKPDVVWRDTASGANSVWLMDGTNVGSSASWPAQDPAWQLAATLDFDGDNKCDLLWRNTNTGKNQLWLMDGGTRKSTSKLPKLVNTWVIAQVDDFDGDGDPDILFRSSKTGRNNLWVMNGTARESKSRVPRIAKAWSTPGH